MIEAFKVNNLRSTFLCILLGLALGLASRADAGQIVWIEAESFDDPGGWTCDWQFIDQMGSPYLMADGLGKPVRDAVKTCPLPVAGRYRLWVRSRDWVPEHHPGRFQVLLNGRVVPRTFGASGQAGWHWEDGGVHDLSGTVLLRLHDLTGYYSRCDLLVLIDDLSWKPPDNQEALTRLRQQQGAVSREILDRGPYDVVVVGGGLAGCLAAVSSARLGCRTALIQDRPVLGGNASVEILVPPVGFWLYSKYDPLDPHETGIVEEIRSHGVQTTEDGVVYSGRLERLVKAEPNLDLHLRVRATGVEMCAPGKIGAVLGMQVPSGQRLRYRGKVFIDCSGDSTMGVAAGAEHRHGREPRSLYQESMAPEVGDRATMGNSLKYVSRDTGTPQRFDAPAWAMKFPRCQDFIPGRHPRLGGEIQWQWMIELGGTRDTYADAEEIRDELLRLIFGIWDHVKNHCPTCRDRGATHALAWVGHVAGKRENRRLVGDYVMRQQDITEQVRFPDRVAYGGWGIDDHWPKGFFHEGRPAQHTHQGVVFSIPYRSLYSKNVENLLMAGRNISASHVALSATRVMLTGAVMGQATGTAAALCVRHDTSPRGVHCNYLTDLQQQLLKDGAHLVDLASSDPRDLARSARASASSERRQADGQVLRASHVLDGHAFAAPGKTHAWGPGPDDPQPWVELAWDRPQSFNSIHVIFLGAAFAPPRFSIEAWTSDGWRKLVEINGPSRRRHVIGLERTTAARLRVVLPNTKQPEVGLTEIRVYDEPPQVVATARRAARVRDLPDPEARLPWEGGLSVLTGADGIDPRKLPGIVLDDTQAEATGLWIPSTYSRPYVQSGYRHDGNTEKGCRSLRFTPRLPRPGRYEVRLAYLALPNRASNTPVTIRTLRGNQTVRLDQRSRPVIDGLFASLGVFDLDTNSTITIANHGTDGYVVVDALQLLPAP